MFNHFRRKSKTRNNGRKGGEVKGKKMNQRKRLKPINRKEKNEKERKNIPIKKKHNP